MADKSFGFEIGKLRMGSIPFLAKNRQALDLAQGIPKDYFLYALEMRLQFRLGISGGTTNGVVAAEVGQNLIEQLEISGNHKVYGDLVRTRLQGSHVYALGCIRGGYIHERTNNGIQLNPTGLNNLFTQTAGVTGAVGNNDVSVTLMYHLIPTRIRPEEALVYLLDPPFWNLLNLFVDWGDATNLVIGGDRVSALTNYGGATGIPQLQVWRHIAKLKGDRYKLNPIPVKETFVGIGATVSQTDQLITPLNVGNFIRSINIVTGTLGANLAKVGDNFQTLSGQTGSPGQSATGAGGGNAAPFFSRIKVKKDDILIRDIEYVTLQEWEGDSKDMTALQYPTGYNNIEFLEGEPSDMTVATAMDTRQIALQNLKFTLEGDIAGAANQKIHVISTELAGIPVYQ